MTRKKNIYFDRKSLGFKLGKRPPSKAEKARGKKKQAAIARDERLRQADQRARERQDREHAKIAERAERKLTKQASAKQFRQLRSEAKKEAVAREKLKGDAELWKEVYGSSNPKRVFPGKLTEAERKALLKLIRLKRKANIGISDILSLASSAKNLTGGGHMAKKKKAKKRKRNRNPRKSKMPAGLRKYWAKMRAKKNPKKKKRRTRKPRKTARSRNSKSRPFIGPNGKVWMSSGRKPRKRRRRRPRKANPRRGKLTIKTNLRPGTKAFRQLVSAYRKAYPHSTVRTA
jgi:hypothetical protein